MNLHNGAIGVFQWHHGLAGMAFLIKCISTTEKGKEKKEEYIYLLEYLCEFQKEISLTPL